MKHALVVLTKVPETGKVKTRLTKERGGIFTPEEARSFYEACLLDVLDVCALVDNSRLWICHDRAGERDQLNLLITRLSRGNRLAGIFMDQGGGWLESIQYAADFLLKPGKKEKLAESVIILGGNLPGLQPYMLKEAIYKLEVLNQSQAGQASAAYLDDRHRQIGAAMVWSSGYNNGLNILGYTCNTPFNYNGIIKKTDEITALDLLGQTAEIPIAPLETVEGIKTADDFKNLIPRLKILTRAARYDASIILPKNTLAFLKGYESISRNNIACM